jgi:maltooligosyltrehalose trehalohydrolase
MSGDRLAQTQSLEKLKLAAGVVILSPCLPLLFMGEEYGEQAPFHYFVSHSDEALIEAVKKGRQEEFAAFGQRGEIHDPQAESTFLHSRIDIQLHRQGTHKILFEFYKRVIDLRKKMPAFNNLSKKQTEVKVLEERVLFVRRWFSGDNVFCIYSFDKNRRDVLLAPPPGTWTKILDSSSKEWGGKGEAAENSVGPEYGEVQISMHPYSLAVYTRQHFPGG